MPRLLPTSNGTISGWTTVPAAKSAYEVLSDFSDSSYLESAGAADSGTLTFTFPGYTTSSYTSAYTSVDQGSRVMPGISSAAFVTRLARIGGTGTRDISLIDDLGTVYATLAFSADSGITETSTASGITWTSATLAARKFGLLLSAGDGTFRWYRFLLSIVETDAIGGGRARLGPTLEEVALFCAICSAPKHVRDLIKVTDPRHPHVGLWVCRDDYDRIDPEPTSPFISEGDFDFDL